MNQATLFGRGRAGRATVVAAVAVIVGGLVTTRGIAAVTYTVSIVDAGAASAAYHSAIDVHARAAGAAWADRFAGGLPSAALEIEVLITELGNGRGGGSSVTSSFVRNANGFNVYEQGAAAEVRRGVDPNGATPDIRISIDPDYLADELWFDPDPAARIAPVSSSRTDAMSFFLHEFGHAFAFNG